MPERVYMKGNEAIARAALKAGCKAFFGYPITPSSEIPETIAKIASENFVFLQAESEVAAINMCLGFASTGKRAMTASSSPGISLKQEGISYIAGCQLPVVIVNINRGGPGLGNIAPEQSDYFQATKGGGHGSYRLIVLAPNSVQEMAEFVMDAFNLAEKYRNPVMILGDAFLGQMTEDMVFPEPRIEKYDNLWAVGKGKKNLICSIFLEPDDLEAHNRKLKAKYDKIKESEVRYEEYRTKDANIVVVGYGIVSRILKGAVDEAREAGLKVGLVRPITLWPFPSEVISRLANRVKGFLVVEMNMGQMVEDVQLAVAGKTKVNFYGRCGGKVPEEAEILTELKKMVKK